MKKTLNIIKNAIVWLVALVAVGMMIFTIVSVRTLDHTERNLFGYRAFIVLSDSMSATDFDAGDVVLTKEVDPSMLRPGDIIAFTSQDPEFFGETITHKIRRLTTDASGEPGFVTYGTTTETDDKTIVTYPYILGKHAVTLPKVGTFFQFLKTTPGYILCILIPFLILILFQGLDCVRLFKQYKEEQMAELKAEKDKLEAERLESQRMMAELLELKAQLAAKQSENEASSVGDTH